MYCQSVETLKCGINNLFEQSNISNTNNIIRKVHSIY